MHTDRVIAEWYGLFLDLWNQRYRLEQQPREWLAALWKALGGDPISADEASVIVTALLLRARAEFVALDRAARDGGVTEDTVARLRQNARSLHERWATVFRAERIPERLPAHLPARAPAHAHEAGYARVTD